MIASQLARDKVRVDPEDSPDGEAGEGALSVVVTATADVEDLALRQHLSIVCPGRR